MTSVKPAIPSFGERYRVERELGRGGMATVYLCTDTKFGRMVAIKLLHPELGAAVGAERFHREIRIATALSHPNILPAFDSGETADGQLFYVMPFVEGQSLRTRLHREKQLPVEDAIRITTQVAGALQHAHSKNIVHRDVKPENILFQGQEAIVADFGIARAVTSASEAEALTQTGVSIGTPTYMSPEQAMGERNIDGRADQYSLACVMYEMLTGQPPFVASTLQSLIMKHVGEPVALITTVRPSVPDEIEDVILRALEKVPADRFPTVGDFGEALTRAIATTGTWARRTGTRTAQMRTPTGLQRPQRRSLAGRVAFAPVRWYIAVLVVAGVLGGLGLAWRARAREASVTDATDLRRIAVLYFADRSPNGQLAYLADGLTENLIDRLSEVRALDVVSKNGVVPFRGGDVTPDSAARALDVGSVVTGTVEPDATQQGMVRVELALVDGGSGSSVKRAMFRVPEDDAFAAIDSVSREASEMLRGTVGEQIRLTGRQSSTEDPIAWRLLLRGERARQDAGTLADADTARARPAFAHADSLLLAAHERDLRWPDPLLARGRLALRRAQASRAPADQRRWLDTALAQVARVIAIAPRNADAHELRGTLRYEMYTRQLATSTGDERELLARAEEDLVAATEINQFQAGALNKLSELYYRKLDVAQANIYARRALDADAYLENADQVVWRLFATSYDLGHGGQAQRWCDEGRRRFGKDPRFVQCRLWIGFMDGETPDPAAAWRAVDEYLPLTPPARRPFFERHARMLAAVTLARAQLGDSARRVVAANRAGRDVDPNGALLVAEALVRTRLGERDEAIRLLTEYLSSFPQHRAGMTRNTWWWKDLDQDKRFRALVH